MNAAHVPADYLPSLEDDVSLEQANQIFWHSLLRHVQADAQTPVDSILDVGCHHGGLLAHLAGSLHPKTLIGIEPSSHSRNRAIFRLRKLALSVSILPPDRWSEVTSDSVDVLTCHEVLHLVEDIDALFSNVFRTLRTNGCAYVVAGCHTENSLWQRWKLQLENSGQLVHDRAPFDIMRAGINAGLKCAMRPLRRDGWIIYDPSHAAMTYSSAEELLDHQYRQKLLFRFIKQS